MSNFERVQAIVAKQLRVEPETITPETDLAEAGYESLDVIETVFALEEEFGIDIPMNANDDIAMRTVADVVAVVDKAQAEKN